MFPRRRRAVPVCPTASFRCRHRGTHSPAPRRRGGVDLHPFLLRANRRGFDGLAESMVTARRASAAERCSSLPGKVGAAVYLQCICTQQQHAEDHAAPMLQCSTAK